jgi:putative methionine-R-sulfoxide reductase with GAF domain
MTEGNNINSIISYLAHSLNEAQTVDELVWDLAQKCISKLNFEDCIIYLFDKERQKLVQRAAFGPKNPKGKIISNPIEIALGKGIVGSVAMNGVAEMIGDTTRDNRYIIDDKRRFSELAVPIKYHDYVIGVIDSEHSQKDFFTTDHLHVLTVIASFTANKIREINQRERLKRAENENGNLLEKLKYFEQTENEHIVLNTQVRTYKLNKSDIVRVEADGNYCIVFTNSGLRIMLAKTLKNIEKEINSRQFIRPHKSHLVNSKYITAHANNELFLTDNTAIQISVRKQSLIKKLLLPK